jgi:hypothetical protein
MEKELIWRNESGSEKLVIRRPFLLAGMAMVEVGNHTPVFGV